jgi:hypothetical protein
MLIQKKLNILRIIFLLLSFFFSIYSSFFYNDSKIIFFTYNLLLLLMVFYGTQIKKNFFNFFFSVMFYLGFWFKFNLSLVFNEGFIFDSVLSTAERIDQVLINLILIILSITFAFYVSNFFFFRKHKISPYKIWYVDQIINRNYLLLSTLFLIFIFLISVFNFYFGFVLKGLVIKDNSLFISYFIKWVFYFGIGLFGGLLLKNYINKSKEAKIFIFLLIIFAFFFSQLSILGRSMVLVVFPIIYCIFYFDKKLTVKYFFAYFFIFCLLSIFSILLSNKNRINFLNQAKINSNLSINENNDFKKFNFQMDEVDKSEYKKVNNFTKEYSYFLIINRWVGIDSFINVTYSAKPSFPFLIDAFKEDINYSENTFYEKHFGLSERKVIINFNNTILKGNTLPGLISFLMYSGNLLFVCFSIFFIIFLFNYFQNFLFLFTKQNIFITAFLIFTIVLRIYSFGYVPKNSYLFFLSVFVTLLIIKIIYSDTFEKILKSLK